MNEIILSAVLNDRNHLSSLKKYRENRFKQTFSLN